VKAMQANGVQTARVAEYVFYNAGKKSEARYSQLSSLYDPNTIRHIKERGECSFLVNGTRCANPTS
jgi:hypothetical protein